LNFKTLFLSKFSRKDKFSRKIKNIVGFYPGDVFLFQTSLVHKSAVHDSSTEFKESNERLEFLGDAILGAIVAEYLFEKFPGRDEGFLTKMRSKIVSRQSLNSLAVKIGLNELIIARLDKNSKTESIYGNAFEALIGAIYLDKGLKVCEEFLLSKVIKPNISLHKLENEETNFKSRIIEWAQKEKQDLVFEIIQEYGEGRAKEFEAVIVLDGKQTTTGRDKSKKGAEQKAAEKLCTELGILNG
jgi:ribonuclease-3